MVPPVALTGLRRPCTWPRTGVKVTTANRDTAGPARLRDVLDDAAVYALVAGVEVAVGALANTVGINPDAETPSAEVDLGVFDLVVRVIPRAALRLTQAVLASMLAAGYGRVVHLSSVTGKEGNPRMALYSATKGLNGLMKVLGREYTTSGITINAVAPAVISAALVDAAPPDIAATMLSRIPMGRFGDLDEVSATITFVASPACLFTTGATFDLSGGRAIY